MRPGGRRVSGACLGWAALCLFLVGCPTEEAPVDDDDATTPVVTEPQALIGGEPLRLELTTCSFSGAAVSRRFVGAAVSLADLLQGGFPAEELRAAGFAPDQIFGCGICLLGR